MGFVDFSDRTNHNHGRDLRRCVPNMFATFCLAVA